MLGAMHTFGQNDAEAVEECGLGGIGLSDAAQADLAVGCAIVVAGNVQVAHAADQWHLSIGDREAQRQRLG